MSGITESGRGMKTPPPNMDTLSKTAVLAIENDLNPKAVHILVEDFNRAADKVNRETVVYPEPSIEIVD